MGGFLWHVGGLVVAIGVMKVVCAAIYTFIWPRK